jgi:hypothetical protein
MSCGWGSRSILGGGQKVSIEVKYQAHPVKDVIANFVKGFELPQGKFIQSYDWFYDSHKGVVVFQLFVGESEE